MNEEMKNQTTEVTELAKRTRQENSCSSMLSFATRGALKGRDLMELGDGSVFCVTSRIVFEVCRVGATARVPDQVRVGNDI